MPGIVDEDVEMAEIGIIGLCGNGDRGGTVEIDREGADISRLSLAAASSPNT
jgi:hypothetical protein